LQALIGAKALLDGFDGSASSISAAFALSTQSAGRPGSRPARLRSGSSFAAAANSRRRIWRSKRATWCIEVQAHANRVGCHEEINVAVLYNSTWAINEFAERTKRTAQAGPLATDNLGHRVDPARRKNPTMALRFHAADLPGACVDVSRKTLARHRIALRQQAPASRCAMVWRHKQRHMVPRRGRNNLSVKMWPTIRAAQEADFVDGEGNLRQYLVGHRLDRGRPILDAAGTTPSPGQGPPRTARGSRRLSSLGAPTAQRPSQARQLRMSSNNAPAHVGCPCWWAEDATIRTRRKTAPMAAHVCLPKPRPDQFYVRPPLRLEPSSICFRSGPLDVKRSSKRAQGEIGPGAKVPADHPRPCAR